VLLITSPTDAKKRKQDDDCRDEEIMKDLKLRVGNAVEGNDLQCDVTDVFRDTHLTSECTVIL